MPRFASGMVPFARDSHAERRPVRHSSALAMIVLAAWCGLVAGWLEVGTRVLLKAMVPTGHLYIMSRHFAWVVPLSNLLLFLAVGLLLALTAKFHPRAIGWVGPRLLCATALLPALMVVGPQIYTLAWFVLATGIAIRVVPWLEAKALNWSRYFVLSFSALLIMVPVVAGFIVGADWIKERREASRSFPSANSPNILLIVLDTVRADRLSLYGYLRNTSPILKRLGRAGHSLRPGPSHGTLDLAVSCKHVHWPLGP